jgi:hypothetical protein
MKDFDMLLASLSVAFHLLILLLSVFTSLSSPAS